MPLFWVSFKHCVISPKLDPFNSWLWPKTRPTYFIMKNSQGTSFIGDFPTAVWSIGVFLNQSWVLEHIQGRHGEDPQLVPKGQVKHLAPCFAASKRGNLREIACPFMWSSLGSFLPTLLSFKFNSKWKCLSPSKTSLHWLNLMVAQTKKWFIPPCSLFQCSTGCPNKFGIGSEMFASEANIV